MRKILIGVVAFTAISITSAQAEPSDRTLSGAAIGAGTGALVAGPIGAVAGGVVGAVVGGPTIRRGKRCWYDSRSYRRCRWR